MTDEVLLPKYDYHLKNEPKDALTGVEIDEETGWRYQYRGIGMTRNASEDRTKEHKVFLDPIPHIILDTDGGKLRGWYKPKHEAKGNRPRPCYTEALLSQPYGGTCSVKCGFCYINSGVRGYRGAGVTTVDPNYGDKIRKQMHNMKIGAAVYMSSFIDPFLELEEFYHNTQHCTDAAIEVGLPIFYLTRKMVPGWAYDALKQNPYSYMQFSINTSNAKDWRRLSPFAEDLETQLAQIREMKRHGIYVSIQVNPIVAGIISNEDICELIWLLADAGADHLIFKFVEITYPVAPGLIDNMRHAFGLERAAKFEALFTQNIGGVKTIDEAYRKHALDMFSAECYMAGVTMSLCYEYEYVRDSVGDIVDKTGVSMGPRYMTSDQCHGHRVPMFTRSSPNEKFQPIESCPPSGCLTCAEQSGGESLVPCGSEELAMAGALTSADLNKPFHIPLSAIKRRKV